MAFVQETKPDLLLQLPRGPGRREGAGRVSWAQRGGAGEVSGAPARPGAQQGRMGLWWDPGSSEGEWGAGKEGGTLTGHWWDPRVARVTGVVAGPLASRRAGLGGCPEEESLAGAGGGGHGGCRGRCTAARLPPGGVPKGEWGPGGCTAAGGNPTDRG